MKNYELHYYEMKLEDIVGQASRLVEMLGNLLESIYLEQEKASHPRVNIEDLF